MDTRAARLARASVTASVSALVTAVSHAAAGGISPHPALVLVGFALALVFCLALTSRAFSPARLIGAVVASQALLHAVFAMSGPPPAALQARMAGTGAMPGMTHSTHATGLSAMPGTDGAGAAAGHHGALASADATANAAGVDGGMLVAHLLAGAVTALALVAGERAFWGLFASLRLAGSALLRVFTVAEPIPALPARSSSLVIAGAIFRPRPRERRMLALRHRGPPIVIA